MIKDYYTLTKPGIIYGNVLTVIAGFFLASYGDIQWRLLVLVLIGISLIIASGCVFNNYIDRDIDALMERTKNRALVRESISAHSALLYGAMLGGVGLVVLFLFTNILTSVVAIVGLFFYVVVYSLYLKRTSVHSALIGGVSGAVPPLVGYLAVTGYVDVGALLLFVILVIWQMPHSFAIGIYRLGDYQAAKLPVLPAVRGIFTTKLQILFYTVLFFITSLLFFVFGYVGILYLSLMIVSGIAWLGVVTLGFYTESSRDKIWAKKVFMVSIIVLLVWCLAIVLERLL